MQRLPRPPDLRRTRPDDLRAVMRLVMDLRGFGPKAWAVRSGLSASTVSNFLNQPAKQGMTNRSLQALAAGADVSPSIFFMGPDQARQTIAAGSSAGASTAALASSLKATSLILVPLLDDQVLLTLQREGFAVVREGWDGSVVPGIDLGPGTFAYRLDSGCVDKRIPRGSTVFVSAEDTEPQDGCMYIIEVEDTIVVRQYRAEPVPRFVPESTETGHREIFPSAAPTLRVVGRVRALLQML